MIPNQFAALEAAFRTGRLDAIRSMLHDRVRRGLYLREVARDGVMWWTRIGIREVAA
jgi:hypothetical protein